MFRNRRQSDPATTATTAGKAPRRSATSPNSRRWTVGGASLRADGNNNKGILRIVTADESVHNVYGSNGSNSSAEGTPTDDTPPKNNIAFKDIEIREYSRTVGDNPSCSSGPPISISWDYDPETKILSVDDYESRRYPRRTHFEMELPREVRDHILRREWEVSRAEIASAVRQNIKIKNQRRATVNNLDKTSKMEEVLEATGRKLLRGLLLKRSTAQQVSELERQYEQAQAARKQARLGHCMAGEYDHDDVAVTDETHADMSLSVY